MIKTLLNIDENLASSIALRFSAYLNKYIPLSLYIAHVEEPDENDHVGQGLVHQAWEEGVINSGKRLVERMLRTENIDCPLAGRPRITVGKRDEEILYQLRSGQYKLYIEGYLNTSDADAFYQLISSPLYSEAPCPILVAKNLSISKKCAMLCADSVDPKLLVEKSCKILGKADFLFDIVYFKFKENDELQFLEEQEAGSQLIETQKLLAEKEKQIENIHVVSGTPEQVGDFLKEYALVASTLPSRKSMRMMTLANSLASVLLVKQLKLRSRYITQGVAMKILIALDTEEYSKAIVNTAALLAKNTLADVVLLGVQEQVTDKPDPQLTTALQGYQQEICATFTEDECPYADVSGMTWTKTEHNGWQASSKGMKEFTLAIRTGGAAKEIVTAARELASDLVLIGGGASGCEWQGELSVPLRVAEDAPCSVLLIKQITDVDKIVSILDQSVVSQDALELVNQLVTLHNTGLKIVGVKEKKSSKEGAIEKTMVDLMKYYNDRKINAWVKLLNSEDVQSYVTTASKEGIVALWMGGKQSFLKKLFSRTMVDKLLETTKSSLLILR